MKITISLLFTLFFWISLEAQNLVPNPSFEQVKDCNIYFDELEKALPWKAYNFTPDIFHVCSESSFLRTPRNTFDVQSPAHGKAYAGILTYHWEFENELIGVKLRQKVKQGSKYEIRFKVSRAAGHARYATNNIGALLTNHPEDAYNSKKFHLRVDEVIEESDIWYEIKGVVQAEEDFDYLVIGNFFPKEDTDIKKMEAGSFDAAYYFIDEVYLGLTQENVPTTQVKAPNAPEHQPYVEKVVKKDPPKKSPPEPDPDKPSFALVGTVYDAESKRPLAAEVEYKVLNTKIAYDYRTDYRTGQFSFSRLTEPQFLLEISARNYYTITQEMNITRFEEVRKDFYLQPLRAGQSIPLSEVGFEAGNTDLNPNSFSELNRLVQVLKDNPTMEIELDGYTDNKDHVGLARQRAQAIKKYLVEIGGISPDRIKIGAYYETSPYRKEGDAAHQDVSSERVEFKILN